MEQQHPLLRSLEVLGTQIETNSTREKALIDSINDVLEPLNDIIKDINNLIKDKLEQIKIKPATRDEKDEEIARLIKSVEDLNTIIDEAQDKITEINGAISENGVTSNDAALNLLKATADSVKDALDTLKGDIENDRVEPKGGRRRRSKLTKRKGVKGGKSRKSRKGKKSRKQKGGWKYKSRSNKRSSRSKSSR